jgi:hypothetical protein
MTACLMQVSAFTYAQRITLTKKNASLTSIFDQINKQSGLNFLVTNELLKGGGFGNSSQVILKPAVQSFRFKVCSK